MNAWQRFKHAFQPCRGPIVRSTYAPPTPVNLRHGWPIETATRLLDEARLGVTVHECECSTCGRHFESRELGDAREKHDD